MFKNTNNALDFQMYFYISSRFWKLLKRLYYGVQHQTVFFEQNITSHLKSLYFLKAHTSNNKSMKTYWFILTRRSMVKNVKSFLHRYKFKRLPIDIYVICCRYFGFLSLKKKNWYKKICQTGFKFDKIIFFLFLLWLLVSSVCNRNPIFIWKPCSYSKVSFYINCNVFQNNFDILAPQKCLS